MTEVAVPQQVIASNGSESTEQQLQQEHQVAVIPSSNGEKTEEQINGTAAPTTPAAAPAAANGHSSKKEKEKKKPVDPKENPEGFLQQVLKSPSALNKVNYHILKWVQHTVEEDESKRKALPCKAGAGANSNSVEPKQFVQWLSDGSVLAQLANKLAPGSVDTIHEGDALKEKANQTANLQAFVDFKDKWGIAPQQAITVEELQAPKWKSAYQALFKTLYYLSTQAQQTFNTAAGITGLDAQQIADEIGGIGKTPVFQRFCHSVSAIISDLINNVAHNQSPAKSPAAAPGENGTNGRVEGTATDNTVSDTQQEKPAASAGGEVAPEEVVVATTIITATTTTTATDAGVNGGGSS